jgi:S-adenosylmethionine:tRNA ribosyltransferase-isomerase
MDVDLFDFHLPEELIAQRPAPERTDSRLLALDKRTGAVEHRRFKDLIDYLHPGDCLVLNDTKVLPARLYGYKRDTGAKVEVLLLKQVGKQRWEALVRPGRKVRPGIVLDFYDPTSDRSEDAPVLSAHVTEPTEAGGRVLEFANNGISDDESFQERLKRIGHMPLPPYIKEPLTDQERYQTVYARHTGSAAAPTAGLHFTHTYLEQIRQKGVRIAQLTLHVGLGTFRPVTVERVEDHKMHAEFYRLPAECADWINRTRQEGGRIIAVGTTAARTLETAAQHMQDGRVHPCEGWTDIFIYPGYEFKLVDALVTNFHLPRSTLLMMICALAGREKVLAAYEEAVRHRYRFFSFGDAMFIY